MLSVLLAINWEPELRGVLTVMIIVFVLMGGTYLVLGTNLGPRLGFMVAFAGLAGWMSLMGGIWWIYGIGLKGEEASWKQIPGSTVIQDVGLLGQAGVIDAPLPVGIDAEPSKVAAALSDQLTEQGWARVAESAPEFGQAVASAGVFLEEEGAFKPGEFSVTAVYEVDPPTESAYPKLFGRDELDQLAFFHKPYYTLVEVAPVVALIPEPGRAPIKPEIDNARAREYVYMLRDLGSKREPAAYICFGSTIVFLAMCWSLHRRDRFVAQNLSQKAIAAA
jgi:hypothetical protein